MMKSLILFAALSLSFMANAVGASRIDFIRGQLGPGDGAVVAGDKRTIYISGEINPNLARDFKSMADQSAAIETVIVDSQGGDMSSALDIADVIRQRKFNIVVEGRCFSACASYLFPAGNMKSVRAHSYLGIHSKTYNYPDSGTVKHSTRLNEVQSALEKNADKQSVRLLDQLRKKESGFIRAVHLSTTLDMAFASYMEHRDLALSNGGAAADDGTCPRINLWVLRRDQVESIGLRNIREFWEPRTPEEKRLLQIYFQVPAAESFFGNAAELKVLCTAQAGKGL
jgi:ATP-dependent protease ClpP protease subunit